MYGLVPVLWIYSGYYAFKPVFKQTPASSIVGLGNVDRLVANPNALGTFLFCLFCRLLFLFVCLFFDLSNPTIRSWHQITPLQVYVNSCPVLNGKCYNRLRVEIPQFLLCRYFFLTYQG